MLDDEREESASVEPDSSREARMASCHCDRAGEANGGRTLRCANRVSENLGKSQRRGLMKEEY